MEGKGNKISFEIAVFYTPFYTENSVNKHSRKVLATETCFRTFLIRTQIRIFEAQNVRKNKAHAV